jgi:S1-C subfamily serine protease
LPSRRLLKPVSSASGFFVSYDGDLITVDHVITGCRELRVVHDGKSNAARVIGSDIAADLVVLRVPDLAKDVAVFGNRLEKPGEAVIVAGYPLQGLLTSKGSVTTGIISALAGPKKDKKLIQITAPIQPGNSGGPLVDADGAVIGVVATKLNSLRVTRATGLLPENINFAVREELVRKLLDKIGIKYAAGRVGVWRGGCRPNISVAAPFVWRCLTGSTLAPFPHSAHRTGRADFPHPALEQDITPSVACDAACSG